MTTVGWGAPAAKYGGAVIEEAGPRRLIEYTGRAKDAEITAWLRRLGINPKSVHELQHLTGRDGRRFIVAVVDDYDELGRPVRQIWQTVPYTPPPEGVLIR